MPKLAFVIPYFKINFFEDTLKALSVQTSNDFNIYIGDDCSKDNPKQIIDKYSDILDIVYKRFDFNLGAKI